MKHKLFTLFLAIAASVGTMFAEKVKIGNLYYNLNATILTAEVDRNSSANGDIIIPSSVTYNSVSYSVTSIGYYAFQNCTGLTSIEIPNSVTSIGQWAFDGCRGLTSVTIPNSVTSIGSDAFRNCSGLTSPVYNTHVFAYMPTSYSGAYTIPNGIESIAGRAFCNCSGLTSVTIPNSVTSIGEEAFSWCSGLTSVTIGNSVTSIGYEAFIGCTGLTSITCEAVTPPALGSNVFSSVNTSIPLYVPAQSVDLYKAADQWKDFTNIQAIGETPDPCITASGTCGAEGDNLTWELSCDGVLTISGTGDMEAYQYECFSTTTAPWNANLEAILSVVIEDGVTNISDFAFFGCSNITSIEIPNSVTSLGSYAFGGCNNLTSAPIGNGVTYIAMEAYGNCRGITSMRIPASVQSIDGDYFTIHCGISFALPPCQGGPGGPIPEDAPRRKTSGGSSDICADIESIVVEEGNTVYDSRDNCNAIIETATNKLIAGCTNTIIPNTVTSIGDNAFWNCSNLTSVTIPNSVTSIGGDAFLGCSSLTSVTIPNSVTSIGYYAFSSCSGLTSITCEATTPPTLEYEVFSYVDKSIPLYVPSQSVDLYKTADQWKEFTNILPIPGTEPTCITASGTCGAEGDNLTWELSCEGVLTIEGSGTMSDFVREGSPWYPYVDNIKSVTLPDGVTSIGSSAFEYCSGLTSVTIPNSVTSIEYRAFYDCSGLTNVTLPDGVTSIGGSAFEYCSGLTNVTIPNSVTSLSGRAFMDCSALTSITCHAITPPTCNGNYVFNNVDKSIPLYVPEGSVEAYRAANGWKDFKNIQPIDVPVPCITASGICGAEGDNLTWELSCDGVLTISGTGAMTDYSSFPQPWYENRDAIKSVIIEDGVTSIGSYAFFSCTGLTSVTIGNGVTFIGSAAFNECTNLSSVNISDLAAWCKISFNGFGATNPLLLAQKFYLNGELVTDLVIPDGVTSIGERAFYGYSSLTSVTFSNSVTSIGEYAFYQCSGLTSVTIPNSVTSIGEFAFYNCSSLPIIDNIHYADTYLAAVADKTLSSYSVKDGTKWIGTRAFNDCLNLTSVEIPNSVTSLGEEAFSGCTGLTSFEIPNSITRIGGAAFGMCDNLATITIPNSVTSIGALAFDACTGLTSITCEAVTPPALENKVFKKVDKSTCTLYVPAESIDAYKAADQWKDFTNILPIGGSVETKETDVNVKYVDNNEAELHAEKISFNVPVAPVIEGFTFVKWEVTGDLEDGIIIRAIYKADVPASSPAVYTNPSNPAQKLIRNGNVYILTDDSRTYTITGQQVK